MEEKEVVSVILFTQDSLDDGAGQDIDPLDHLNLPFR